MKKAILLLFILFTSYQSSAQINVGSKEMMGIKPGDFERGDLEKLKKTTTIFVYREQDRNDLPKMKQALKEAWNYTKLKFVRYKDFKEENYKNGYSFFTLGFTDKFEISRPNTPSQRTVHYTYFYLSLWMKEGEEKKYFSRIELSATMDTYDHVAYNYNKTLDFFYNESKFYNWNIGFLKNALQFVNKHLTNKELRWIYSSDTFGDLKPLRTKTLYIPEYTLIKHWMRMETDELRHKPNRLLRKYSYTYKFVSAKKLSELILNSEEEIYYLSYVKSSGNKLISVINSKTGEIVYSKYKWVSVRIKSKDFKTLAKEIAKE